MHVKVPFVVGLVLGCGMLSAQAQVPTSPAAEVSVAATAAAASPLLPGVDEPVGGSMARSVALLAAGALAAARLTRRRRLVA